MKPFFKKIAILAGASFILGVFCAGLYFSPVSIELIGVILIFSGVCGGVFLNLEQFQKNTFVSIANKNQIIILDESIAMIPHVDNQQFVKYQIFRKHFPLITDFKMDFLNDENYSFSQNSSWACGDKHLGMNYV